jgi:hypothetical protein
MVYPAAKYLASLRTASQTARGSYVRPALFHELGVATQRSIDRDIMERSVLPYRVSTQLITE